MKASYSKNEDYFFVDVLYYEQRLFPPQYFSVFPVTQNKGISFLFRLRRLYIHRLVVLYACLHSAASSANTDGNGTESDDHDDVVSEDDNAGSFSTNFFRHHSHRPVSYCRQKGLARSTIRLDPVLESALVLGPNGLNRRSGTTSHETSGSLFVRRPLHTFASHTVPVLFNLSLSLSYSHRSCQFVHESEAAAAAAAAIVAATNPRRLHFGRSHHCTSVSIAKQ